MTLAGGHSAGLGRSGGSRLDAGRGRRGLELEHPEGHPADFLVVLIAEDGAGVDEVADPEGRGLLLGDRFDHRGRRDLVARPQVAGVPLVAVGGDHRGVAGVGQKLVQVVLLVVGRLRGLRHLEAAQDPGLHHGGGCDDAAVRRALGGLRIRVDRIAVTQDVAPVADHRLVHQVRADLRRTLHGTDVFLQLGFELLAFPVLRTHLDLSSMILANAAPGADPAPQWR